MELKIIVWLIAAGVIVISSLSILLALGKKSYSGDTVSHAEPSVQATAAGPEAAVSRPVRKRHNYLRIFLEIASRVLFLAFLAGAGWCYQIYVKHSYGLDLSRIDAATQTLTIKRGEDAFMLKAAPRVTIDLRIFNTQIKPFGQNLGQLSLISHILIAAPMAGADIDNFDKYICEFSSDGQISLAQVIAANADARDGIERFSKDPQGGCAKVTAVPLHLETFEHKGVIHDLWEITAMNEYRYDLKKFLAVMAFEKVACPQRPKRRQ